jgi:hypothetical protein
MIVDLLELMALFLLSFFWAPPPPIRIIVWVILAIALVLEVLPFAGFHQGVLR